MFVSSTCLHITCWRTYYYNYSWSTCERFADSSFLFWSPSNLLRPFQFQLGCHACHAIQAAAKNDADESRLTVMRACAENPNRTWFAVSNQYNRTTIRKRNQRQSMTRIRTVPPLLSSRRSNNACVSRRHVHVLNAVLTGWHIHAILVLACESGGAKNDNSSVLK